MNNISQIKDCFGCGLCSVVCKHNVIDMQQNENGFYQPTIIRQDECVNCGLCTKVCSFINEDTFIKPIHSYAGWSKNAIIRKKSTSGGISFELAKFMLSQGYKFCGVKYNTELERAEHYIATDINGLYESQGSKYLQSFTQKAYKQIDRRQKYIVVGSPCQIASFRRYVDIFHCSDNFILLDFFCHGVPSYLLWSKYIKEHTSEIGTPKAVSWRNKLRGWHNSYCITLEGEKKIIQSWNGKDDFFAMFLGNACLSKACFESCKFKYNHSAADIRVGDFWGNTYKFNDEGVCSVIAFTAKGDKILKMANVELYEHSFEFVAEGQMKSNPNKPWYYERCMKRLKNKDSRLAHISFFVRVYKKLRGHINQIKQISHI